MKKIEIFIATHKDYIFPQDEIYTPIHVGKALSPLELNIATDDSGEHISSLNQNFCELTALYWMWKNSDADILGLVHYRRYFTGSLPFQDLGILQSNDFDFKQGVNIILAKKIFFAKVVDPNLKFDLLNHYTVFEQFCLAHFAKDWDAVRDVINVIYPEYIKSFYHVSDSKYGLSLFNMFIADRSFVNQYCEWLFKILFRLKEKVDISQYDTYQARLFGFLSERLLNIYVYHHRKTLNIEYRDVFMLE